MSTVVRQRAYGHGVKCDHDESAYTRPAEEPPGTLGEVFIIASHRRGTALGASPRRYARRRAATKRSTVYIGAGGHVILAFWHAQQLMIPSGYRGAGAHVLISQHGDGEIIARIIARFGHQAIRGSNTRGGAGALRALIKLGHASKDLVVTPAAQRTTTGGQARCHPTGQSHRTSNCSLSLCLLNKTTVRKLGSLHGSLSLFSRFVSLWQGDVCLAGRRRSRARSTPSVARNRTQPAHGRGRASGDTYNRQLHDLMFAAHGGPAHSSP